MQILIIEDEKPAARMLQRKLEKLHLEVHKMLHSVEESLQWFAENPQPDLIFLDIQLSDGLSFEIFEHFSITSAIIFTTAYDNYSLKAFSVNSVDYLLKPIDDKALQKAIEKYQTHFSKVQSPALNIEELKKALFPEAEKSYKNRLTFKHGNHLKIIDIQEIECFFSENKGTYIHTTDNRDYLIDQTLEQIEKDLHPNHFFRVSRKFIVQLKQIKDILVYSNSRLKIVLPSYTQDEVIVSRERVSEFKEWLN